MCADRLSRRALVTGASSGIGRAFADHLASRGFHLVLTARRADRLETAAAEIRERHGVDVQIIVADLADPAAPTTIVNTLRERGLSIDVLVNNAGFGVAGRYLDASWTQHAAFLQVMVTAVCELSYRLLPPMVERGWGRIINVASLAAHVPAPAGHTLYAASKAFFVRASEALHAEYAPRGVHVTAVCPGFTYSEFHDVLGTREKVDRMPRFMWLDAATVAADGCAAAERGQPVVIVARVNRFIAWVMRTVPPSTARAIAARTGGRYRKA